LALVVQEMQTVAILYLTHLHQLVAVLVESRIEMVWLVVQAVVVVATVHLLLQQLRVVLHHHQDKETQEAVVVVEKILVRLVAVALMRQVYLLLHLTPMVAQVEQG
jgi:hypothetical protein